MQYSIWVFKVSQVDRGKFIFPLLMKLKKGKFSEKNIFYWVRNLFGFLFIRATE